MKTIADYISLAEQDKQLLLRHVYKIIKSTAPEAEESISYGMPAFKYKKKPLIYFGAFKNHYSLFPTSGPIAELSNELKSFTVAKGTIQFTDNKPLPDDLIKKIVRYRLAQIDGTK